MPPQTTTWKAEPHTIAKIDILRGYLQAWFRILGRQEYWKHLVYVDGFAGPGKYTNYSAGSPIVALQEAESALKDLGLEWRAGSIHCAFIEPDLDRFNHLQAEIEPFVQHGKINLHLYNKTFVKGLDQLAEDFPAPFESSTPLFVFIDPFGATGAPFSFVERILSSPTSEVLINLDADGIARIMLVDGSEAHENLLNEIFGDDSWKNLLKEYRSFSLLAREVLSLYKAKLRSLPNVKYAFPFEMQNAVGSINYFLVFASQHSLGLKKMKDAMKRIDQTGSYRFADGSVNQSALFRFDEPQQYSSQLFSRFRKMRVAYNELNDYVLNELPFTTPNGVLRELERKGLIRVQRRSGKRNRGSFAEGDVIEFEGEEPPKQQAFDL